MEDILKNHVYGYNERFGFYIIMCEWKLDFDNIIVCVKPERKYTNYSFWYLRRYLITQIDYLEKQGYIFSHICEMNVTLISDLRNMTYQLYILQPKTMLDGKMNEKSSRNPELIKTLRNISHPLNEIYKCMFPPEKK